jgi:pantoate--beta-alanine ligase
MPIEVVETIQALRERVAQARGARRRIGLVPTMGALHAGHRRLIDTARVECDFVVVSIFVNPLQFDRDDDLQKYPRSLVADVELCSASGVAVVFAPPVGEMYPAPPDCTVDVGRVADHLCGPYRPGHFRGVAMVVMKLFQIAQPDRGYFGEKDAQQLAVVRHLVSDLNVPVEIVAVPTVREVDGLAISSRNQRLRPDERRIATALYEALGAVKQQISAGVTDPARLREAGALVIQQRQGVRLEYLEIVDPREMQPVERVEAPVIAAGAIWVGTTRLIDNVLCAPPAASKPAGMPSPGGFGEAGRGA